MTTPTTPTRFEDRLLAQLQRIVADNPAPHPAPARTTTAPRRTRLALSGAGLAVTAVAATVVLATTSGGTSAAYAVSSQSDGTISVTINTLRDAAGLQAKLRADGVSAIVSYDANPVKCSPGGPGVVAEAGAASSSGAAPSGAPPVGAVTHVLGTAGDADAGPSHITAGSAPPPGGDGPIGLSVSKSGPGDGATFTIDPSAITSDETVVIATSTGKFNSLAMGIVKGAAASAPALPCVPTVAP